MTKSLLPFEPQSTRTWTMAASVASDRTPSSPNARPPPDIIRFKFWEVFLPPPLNSLKGALVPNFLIKRRKYRRIAVEVHRVPVSATQWYEECVVRILEPSSVEARRRLRQRHRHEVVDEEESVEDDSTSTAGVPVEFLDGSNPAGSDWKAKYRFPVKAVSVKGSFKTTVVVDIRLGRIHQIRELIFDSVDEAEDFTTSFQAELGREEERAQARLEVSLGSTRLAPSESITFLIELVSAWDLPVGDMSSSDPYVKVSFDGKEVHKTKYIPKTLDPVWTLKTGSLFLWTVDARQLFLSEGLMCLVMDFDKVGNDEMLASVFLPPKLLYDAKGERVELKLGPPPGKDRDDVPGYLAIRCRRASDYDKRFMAEYEQSGESVNELESFKNFTKHAFESAGGKGNIQSMLTRNVRTVKDKDHPNGTKQYKMRPGPDPKREEETTWMTKQDIDEEYLKDSHRWVDSGTGRLGRLFVEVLGCDGLPNLDTGGFAGNKTDAFVALVFEDTVATTDIIDDCLSPRWMPWTKRAFIFHIYHSSSQLFLGVFDYDQSMNPTDDHDLVGRVSVDISNLRKDSLYTLKYNIYTTARMSLRKRMGTVTIRLRLEIEDERQLLLSSLEPPPTMYVNSKRRKDFRIVRYTCTGKYDMETYNMKVINSYIEELLALQHVLFYLQDGFVALVLWRSTSMLIGGKQFRLPVHSVTAFLAFVLVVERPQLFPSFFLFGVAWLLLAAMSYRRGLPDVWSRCKSYTELSQALILGESKVPPDSIEAYYNYDKAQAFLESWKKRISDAEKEAAKAYEESLKTQEEYAQEMEEFGDATTDLSTKRGEFSIDPFKPILFPVQQNLAMICRYVRHVKYVIFWEECYISFWVVSGCLLLAIIFMFVPWFFLLKWTARILVWTFFGPWMKLVDIYYVSKIEPPSEEEVALRKERNREKRRLAASAAVTEARIKRENIAKTKAMKKYMFGKFVVRVPVLKQARYRDLPLPESTAIPYRPDRVPLSELAMQEAGYKRVRLPGQHLVGDMIPRVESHGFTEAPIGQATAHPHLLDTNGIGHHTPDSTLAAYTKIGSVVVTAAIVTWVGVPLLSSATEMFLKWVG